MGGEAEASAEVVGAASTLHVRCSNGSKFTVSIDLSSTVAALKQVLAEHSEVAADQQRLIYKGRVLKDDHSLDSYGLQSEHTIHLVRGATPATGPPAAPAAARAAAPAVPPSASPAAGTGANPLTGGLGGLLGATGSGLGALPEFQQVHQQLMQNPNLMREMMNMPAVQNLMNNPDLMRTLIMSNPQMREVIDRNPDLAHILNDPATLRQTLDAARNPELMREMMRNTDRAMSNIEASPEGFNMLRRMYETVQEPLLNAAAMGTEAGNTEAAAMNPFAALLTRPAAAADQMQQQQDPAAGGQTVLPNTAPLPNPWNPPARGAAGEATEQTPSGLGNLGGLGALGSLGGLGGLEGLGALGPGAGEAGTGLEQMLQNPAILQAMQTLLSNPQYINQVLNMTPQLRNLLGANPQFRDMMQNPEFLRQISSPESLQQMLTLQQSLLSQLGRQPGQGEQVGLGGGLASLFGFPTTPEVNVLPPEQLYATQLSQLQDMGFFDTQENIRALAATGGNVHAAVERLLGNP